MRTMGSLHAPDALAEGFALVANCFDDDTADRVSEAYSAAA